MYNLKFKTLVIVAYFISSQLLNAQNNPIYLGSDGDGATYNSIGSEGEVFQLPVSLISFYSICDNNYLTLKWSTASESNNDYFTIERSEDASNWLIMGTMSGAGNSNTVQDYSFYIDDMFIKSAYYRLIQTDYNGDFEYLKPIYAISCNEKKELDVSIFMDASSKCLNINYNSNQDSVKNCEIINADGKIIANFSRNLQKIDVSNYQSGKYYIIINLNNKKITKPFICI